MTTKSTYKKSEIFFFDIEKNNRSYLNIFTGYVHSSKRQKKLLFSYIARDNYFFPNLTLRENILHSMVKNNSNYPKSTLEEICRKNNNKYLTNILNNITNIDHYPKDASKRNIKLSSIIRGLLQKTSYLFIEEPEFSLKSEDIDLFFKALHMQNNIYNWSVFIHSKDESLKIKHANKIVTKENNKYHTKSTEPLIYQQQPGILIFENFEI